MKAPISQGKEFDLLAAGTHLAICTQIINIGMQPSEYQGQPREAVKLKIRFETPLERVSWTNKEGIEQEGPKVIWLTCTFSMHENARLRKIVHGWLGVTLSDQDARDYDIEQLLGKACLISVVHRDYNGKVYANIDSVTPLMKGMTAPAPEGEVFYFDCYNHTAEEFARLPDWLQKLVERGTTLRQEQRQRVESGIDYLKQNYQGFREQTAAQRAEADVPDRFANTDDFQESDIPF